MIENNYCGKCPICSPKIFSFWYPSRKHRRSHEEIVLEKRKKQEILELKRYNREAWKARIKRRKLK